jgi:hypothetical protein
MTFWLCTMLPLAGAVDLDVIIFIRLKYSILTWSLMLLLSCLPVLVQSCLPIAGPTELAFWFMVLYYLFLNW